MATFRLAFRLQPPGPFGLPDGDRVVVSTMEGGREIVGPAIDTRTGQVASHGTLSQYRSPEQAVDLSIASHTSELTLTDNYLRLSVDADSAQDAVDTAIPLADRLSQALSALHGTRFSATYLSTEDKLGNPQPVRARPQQLLRFEVTVFNTAELCDRVRTAFAWAENADAPARKALLYFEHACLLQEYSSTLQPLSTHASFTQALAFLQLFKALTSIVGEPGTDRDYQRRSATLGLAADFWQTKVKPLYTVRCEEDVAHYSREMPEPGVFLRRYGEAAAVFNEALSAYMSAS